MESYPQARGMADKGGGFLRSTGYCPFRMGTDAPQEEWLVACMCGRSDLREEVILHVTGGNPLAT